MVVVRGLQHFSVSPRHLGFWFFSFWVFGLRVWGQSLTILDLLVFGTNLGIHIFEFSNSDFQGSCWDMMH